MLNRANLSNEPAIRRRLRARTVLPLAVSAVVAACSWATETTCADGVGCVDATGGSSAGGNAASQGGAAERGGSANGGGMAGESGAGGVSQGGGAGGESAAGASGGAGGNPNDCDVPEGDSDLIAHPCLVDEAHALFVAPSGSDAASGTRKAPVKTIERALALAAASPGKAIVACAASTAYPTAVAITSSAHLYGGFSCPDSEAPWVHQDKLRTRVQPTAQGPALEVRSVGGRVELEDFEFQAADAIAPGTSSIAALIVDSPEVILRRTKLSAGNAAPGANGVAGANGEDGKDPGNALKGRDAACDGQDETQKGGGWATTAALCGSLGGNGGVASMNSLGAAGDPGLPLTNVTPASGTTVENGGGRAAAISNAENGVHGGRGAHGDARNVGSTANDNGTFRARATSPVPLRPKAPTAFRVRAEAAAAPATPGSSRRASEPAAAAAWAVAAAKRVQAAAPVAPRWRSCPGTAA